MPNITILAHDTFCPEGLTFDANPGDNLLQLLIKHKIKIEHACEGQGTCATCHVYVREGIDNLNEMEDIEDDSLNRAWEVDMDSRLSCQVVIGNDDIIIEIPKYTLNQVSESN